MTDLIQLVEHLNKTFLDNTKLFDGISAEAYDNGAFCLWFDASSNSHYVIHNWGEKPSKKEVIEMFQEWLMSLVERVSDTLTDVTDLFADELKKNVEVEDMSLAVDEITGKPPTNNEDSEWHDPFASPNPFGGGVMNKPIPF